MQGGEEADEGTVQRAEQDLSEAGRGVELWRKKVKQLQDKVSRTGSRTRSASHTELIVGGGGRLTRGAVW